MQIKVILIEDEEPARSLLKTYLKDLTMLEIIGEFSDGFSGTKAINELKPDLVFLDIQMPKLTGFEVLEIIEHKSEIIFTTAYDEFAIKAFELNAVDYLLKPFSKDRFNQAVQKALAKIKSEQKEDVNIKLLTQTIDNKEEFLDRIAIKSGTMIHVVPADRIHFLSAEGDYVMIHTKEGKYLKEKTMKYFESHLDSKQFVRIHRSHIVNVNEISRIEHYDKESYMVFMKNNIQLKASINGYKLLKELIKL